MGTVIQLISKLAAMVSTKGKPKADDQEDRSWTELTSETSLSKSRWREQCRNDLQLTETVLIPTKGSPPCLDGPEIDTGSLWSLWSMYLLNQSRSAYTCWQTNL